MKTKQTYRIFYSRIHSIIFRYENFFKGRYTFLYIKVIILVTNILNFQIIFAMQGIVIIFITVVIIIVCLIVGVVFYCKKYVCRKRSTEPSYQPAPRMDMIIQTDEEVMSIRQNSKPVYTACQNVKLPSCDVSTASTCICEEGNQPVDNKSRCCQWEH